MKLSTAERDSMPASDFAIPELRKYPIKIHGRPNRSHAVNALARVSANGSAEEKRRVRAAVYREYPDLGRASRRLNG